MTHAVFPANFLSEFFKHFFRNAYSSFSIVIKTLFSIAIGMVPLTGWNLMIRSYLWLQKLTLALIKRIFLSFFMTHFYLRILAFKTNCIQILNYSRFRWSTRIISIWLARIFIIYRLHMYLIYLKVNLRACFILV